MIIVTGGNGFIGANLVNSLRNLGKEVHVVDFEGDAFCDPTSFLKLIREKKEFAQKIEVIFHQGACSDTTCYDPFYMMRVNLNYSMALMNICMNKNIRVIYASSAAVYGDGPYKDNGNTNPKNIYARSKSMFDEYVTCFLNEPNISQVVGLRYFNVYGPREHNKGKMASVIYQFYNQIKKNKKIKIFKNSENYTRDFISVEDLIKVNLHFYENKHISGIYNCGTGISRSFYDIAKIMQQHYEFEIEEIDMPEQLHGKYQKYTCSDNSRLIREANYTDDFFTLEDGIKHYIDFLETK
jgi:ADP-L-glycero-D-manno-heptose 6-epimerase